MSDIFISYASEDRSRIEPLVGALQNRGWSVWWDRRILPGKTWRQVIEAALEEARCVIVIWSAVSVDSDWVQAEAEDARERGILVPALVDEVRIPLEFRRIQAARLIGWTGDENYAGFADLCEAIGTVLDKATSDKGLRAAASIAGGLSVGPAETVDARHAQEAEAAAKAAEERRQRGEAETAERRVREQAQAAANAAEELRERAEAKAADAQVQQHSAEPDPVIGLEKPPGGGMADYRPPIVRWTVAAVTLVFAGYFVWNEYSARPDPSSGLRLPAQITPATDTKSSRDISAQRTEPARDRTNQPPAGAASQNDGHAATSGPYPGGVGAGIVGGTPGSSSGSGAERAAGAVVGRRTETQTTSQRPARIRVGGNVQAAKLIRQPKPVYPPLARKMRIEGVVRLNVLIGTDGTVQNLSLVSGPPMLVEAARDAVKQWVYQPTLVNGKPVEVATQAYVNFALSH